MKKRMILSIFSVLFAFLSFGTPVVATLSVMDFGDTGWQTFKWIPPSNWSGTMGIGVSNNVGDIDFPSTLLIDNLVNIGPEWNRSFEGSLAGYTAHGEGVNIGTKVIADSNSLYLPTEGIYFAILDAYGADTSLFGGSIGAYLTFPVSTQAGVGVSFDWAFLAHDYYTFQDFAFVFFENVDKISIERISQIGPAQLVIEPATLLFLSFGLAGLIGYNRKVLFKKGI